MACLRIRGWGSIPFPAYGLPILKSPQRGSRRVIKNPGNGLASSGAGLLSPHRGDSKGAGRGGAYLRRSGDGAPLRGVGLLYRLRLDY